VALPCPFDSGERFRLNGSRGRRDHADGQRLRPVSHRLWCEALWQRDHHRALVFEYRDGKDKLFRLGGRSTATVVGSDRQAVLRFEQPLCGLPVPVSVTGPNRTVLSGHNRTTEENQSLFIYNCIVSNFWNKYHWLLFTVAATKYL
jgi:hypothetical protein